MTAVGPAPPGAEPGRDAPTLVAAFFGLHTLSDVLDDRLWLLPLPGLQADPAPRELLTRVRAPVPASPRRPSHP
ncbi:hypothetical protein [Streptomyces cyslabdanicus]|uniref:hypothetical protein n=1 Tax=Streptomyces cyslabdanicus TaxID=1470456 RepID=UPI004043D930